MPDTLPQKPAKFTPFPFFSHPTAILLFGGFMFLCIMAYFFSGTGKSLHTGSSVSPAVVSDQTKISSAYLGNITDRQVELVMMTERLGRASLFLHGNIIHDRRGQETQDYFHDFILANLEPETEYGVLFCTGTNCGPENRFGLDGSISADINPQAVSGKQFIRPGTPMRIKTGASLNVADTMPSIIYGKLEPNKEPSLILFQMTGNSGVGSSQLLTLTDFSPGFAMDLANAREITLDNYFPINEETTVNISRIMINNNKAETSYRYFDISNQPLSL